MYIRPLTISRSSTERLLPPLLAGGIRGPIKDHSSSVTSLGYRNLLRSYRPRFSFVHTGSLSESGPQSGNHKRLNRFKVFPDGHLASTRSVACKHASSVRQVKTYATPRGGADTDSMWER